MHHSIRVELIQSIINWLIHQRIGPIQVLGVGVSEGWYSEGLEGEWGD